MEQTVTLKCPVCDHETTRQIYARLDAQAEPEVKKTLLEGKLFTFECDNCGAQRQIDNDFLYLDHEKKVIIALIPSLAARKADMEKILTQFMRQSEHDLSQYSLRVVRSAATLVEKVTIFEQGLNDIVVEIVKLLTDGLFAKERPNETVKARYFYLVHKEKKILYITDKDQLLVDFHQSLVDFSQDKYNKAVREDYKGRFIVVDENWAANLLENKPGMAVEEYTEEVTPKEMTPQEKHRLQNALNKKRKHK